MTYVAFKYRFGVLGKILYIEYTAIAACSMLGIMVDSKFSNIDTSIFALVFLLIVYFIVFAPWTKTNPSFNSAAIKINTDAYFIFAIIYVFCSIIMLKCYSQAIMNIIRSGNWTYNLYLGYSNELVFPFNNAIEYYAIQIVGYLRLLALIIGFAMLKDKRKVVMGIVLLVSGIATCFANAIYTSSRGAMLDLCLISFALFCFFKNDLFITAKKLITLVSFTAFLMILFFSIQITISRFSSGGALISIVEYFGQPPIYFCVETNSLHEAMLGRFSWGVLLGDPAFPSEFSSWIRAFYTFVGALYADWGYIGTLVICIFINIGMNKVLNKSKFGICRTYFVFFVYSQFVNGAFTFGRAKCYEFIVFFFVYLFLFFVESFPFTLKLGNRYVFGNNISN